MKTGPTLHIAAINVVCGCESGMRFYLFPLYHILPSTVKMEIENVLCPFECTKYQPPTHFCGLKYGSVISVATKVSAHHRAASWVPGANPHPEAGKSFH